MQAASRPGSSTARARESSPSGTTARSRLPFSLLGILLLVSGSGAMVWAEERGLQEMETHIISLTFDRLPAMGPLGYWRPREISNLILRTLERHQIQAAGFVVEEKVEDDPPSYFVLDDWARLGHLLGNNSYSYVDLNQLGIDDFIAHVRDGQKYLRRVAQVYRFNFRYFRFPLLHEGETERKKKEVAKILHNGGYTIAPVTVETSDFLFNRPYLEHQSELEVLEELKKTYLAHVGHCLDYAEEQSRKVFGKNIPHILYLHAGIATASYLDDLVQLLQQRGYRFASLPEVLADPVFQTEEEYVGPLGLTFLDRVAATRGLPFEENPCPVESELVR